MSSKHWKKAVILHFLNGQFPRGKEKGIQVGDVLYQEMAKSMLYITVEDKEKDEVVDIIVNSAKSGAYGHYGDGKIFVSDIEEAYTISEETREDED